MQKRLVVVLVIVAAQALVPLAGAGAAERVVTLKDSQFNPKSVTIAPGDRIVWTHEDGTREHTVTADDGSFDSHPDCQPNCMKRGETFSTVFRTAGTYAYYCKVHGGRGGVGMAGTIVVRAGAQASPTPTRTTAPVPVPTGTAAPAPQPQPVPSPTGLPRTGPVPSGPMAITATALLGAGFSLAGPALVAVMRRRRIHR